MTVGSMNCDSCKKDINPIFGYIEITITDWKDYKSGESNKIIYHKNCEIELAERLMRIE